MRPQGFSQGSNGLEDLGWNDMGFEPPKAAEAPRDEDHDAFGEDVVEHPRAHPTGLTPVGSPVHDQQAEIAERFADESGDAGDDEIDETAELFEPAAVAEVTADVEVDVDVEEGRAPSPIRAKSFVSKPAVVAVVPVPAPRRAPRARVAAGSKGKAAFTLRLDPNRHLKLRLACAVDGRSAQQLVTDALDQLLERMPDLDGLADKAKRGGKTNEQVAS